MKIRISRNFFFLVAQNQRLEFLGVSPWSWIVSRLPTFRDSFEATCVHGEFKGVCSQIGLGEFSGIFQVFQCSWPVSRPPTSMDSSKASHVPWIGMKLSGIFQGFSLSMDNFKAPHVHQEFQGSPCPWTVSRLCPGGSFKTPHIS